MGARSSAHRASPDCRAPVRGSRLRCLPPRARGAHPRSNARTDMSVSPADDTTRGRWLRHVLGQSSPTPQEHRGVQRLRLVPPSRSPRRTTRLRPTASACRSSRRPARRRLCDRAGDDGAPRDPGYSETVEDQRFMRAVREAATGAAHERWMGMLGRPGDATRSGAATRRAIARSQPADAAVPPEPAGDHSSQRPVVPPPACQSDQCPSRPPLSRSPTLARTAQLVHEIHPQQGPQKARVRSPDGRGSTCFCGRRAICGDLERAA